MRLLSCAFASVLVSLASCTSADVLDGLVPFPCAKDGTCPSGFGCNQGRCQSNGGAVREGGAGLPDDSICSGSDVCSDGACLFGACAVDPGDGTCPDDHAALVFTQCLRACSDTAPCPSGLACIWMEGGSDGTFLEQACVSEAQAAEQGASCTDATGCPGYGSEVSPYVCLDGSCVLECWPGQIDCPPGTYCSLASDSNAAGCFPTQ